MCCFQIKQRNFSKLPLYFELKYANKKGMSTFQKRWMVVSKDINIVSTDLSKWIIFCDIPRWSKGPTLWDRGSINKLAFGIFNNLHASFSQVKTKLKGHQKRITGLAFSHNLNVLVSSGADSQVKKNRVFCNHNQLVAEMLSRAQPPSCLAYTCPFLSFTIHIKIISWWPQGQDHFLMATGPGLDWRCSLKWMSLETFLFTFFMPGLCQRFYFSFPMPCILVFLLGKFNFKKNKKKNLLTFFFLFFFTFIIGENMNNSTKLCILGASTQKCHPHPFQL